MPTTVKSKGPVAPCTALDPEAPGPSPCPHLDLSQLRVRQQLLRRGHAQSSGAPSCQLQQGQHRRIFAAAAAAAASSRAFASRCAGRCTRRVSTRRGIRRRAALEMQQRALGAQQGRQAQAGAAAAAGNQALQAAAAAQRQPQQQAVAGGGA